MKKTSWELINELEEKGDLKTLVMAGFCKPSVMVDLEIVRRVEAKLSVSKHKNKTVVIDTVASEFDTCRRSVYRIFKYMKGCGKPEV